jgi:DNA mismatch repair protein MutS2
MQIYPQRLTDKLGFSQIRSFTQRFARSEWAREALSTLEPSSNRTFVERELDLVAECMAVLQKDDPFPLRNLPDIRKALDDASVQGALIPAKIFNEVFEVVATARRIKAYVKKRSDDYPHLHDAATGFIPLRELEDHIREIISEDDEVRDDATHELRSLRKQLLQRRSDLRNTIDKVFQRVSNKGMASDEGPTLRSGRMVIPIRVEHKRKVEGFVHDVSASGQTVYLEPSEALSINNDIRSLEVAERREIERILRQLTGTVRRSLDEIRQNVDTLTQFDLWFSKAHTGIALDGSIPTINDEDVIELRQARNPILELKNRERLPENQEEIVPLNMDLQPDERALIITGPNAGGKSVAMKTVGLCVMMTQAGIPIPAADTTHLPLFEGLFVDMGDDQSIEDDLSTFSSRLEWMRTTMELASPDSLVLIDEAAAGTDPEEGGTLFQSFIEWLIDHQARVLVTTHHGSLKVFAHDHDQAINGSMEFDQSTLNPTYRFQKGIPGSSYAFEIAERMNLSKEVLDRARTLLGESKGSLESLITELEAKTQEAEQLRVKYDTELAQMKAEKHTYEDKRRSIDKEREEIRAKALEEAKSIVDDANRKIEQAVERISSLDKSDKDQIKEIRSEVEEHKSSVQEEWQEQQEREQEQETQYQDSDEAPQIGDKVRLEDGSTTGELVDIQGNKAVVNANGLRLKTNFKKLIKVSEKRHRKQQKKQRRTEVIGGDNGQSGSRHSAPAAKPSIDVRGMRAHQAVQEVTYYLDNAIARGLNQVEIIHGKGQGILRKQIHEYLKTRQEVISFDIAPIEQGGAGCTIVKL